MSELETEGVLISERAQTNNVETEGSSQETVAQKSHEIKTESNSKVETTVTTLVTTTDLVMSNDKEERENEETQPPLGTFESALIEESTKTIEANTDPFESVKHEEGVLHAQQNELTQDVKKNQINNQKDESDMTIKTTTTTTMATTTVTTIEKNENESNELMDPKSSNEHAEHITYTKDGNAIYTDPKTQHKYKWSAAENSWIYFQSESNVATTTTDNPYENEHYKWCTERNQWIPKVTQKAAETTTTNNAQTETEFYKWDAAKNAWIPKVHTQQASATAAGPADAAAVTYGIDEDGQRVYTDRDGAVFFWDAAKSAWFPKIDDDFMARYQMNYGFIDNTSAGEEERKLRAEAEEKRKAAELQQMTEEARAAAAAAARTLTAGVPGSVTTSMKRKAVQEPPTWFDLNPEQNTKVYVSNLPLDITLDEFAEVMSKCGMIMRDPQTQKIKLKLYTEADGQIKGDGLCDYIKVESVDLALKILDESDVRGHKIRVQRAKFQMRGEYNPALKPKRKKKDKEKLQKMKEKLFDWRPEKLRGERSKHEKIVIIKNLFSPEVFEKEVQLILDYQNDLREECAKCGTVRKVVIYDLHPEGVAQVNMSCPEEADLVIKMMHGRYFGQRLLAAEHWDGKTKYKISETETAAKCRLNNWDDFLESKADRKQQQQQQQQDTATEAEN